MGNKGQNYGPQLIECQLMSDRMLCNLSAVDEFCRALATLRGEEFVEPVVSELKEERRPLSVETCGQTLRPSKQSKICARRPNAPPDQLGDDLSICLARVLETSVYFELISHFLLRQCTRALSSLDRRTS